MIEKNGVKMKQFYGMSSATAMEKHSGGVAEYRSEDTATVSNVVNVTTISSGVQVGRHH